MSSIFFDAIQELLQSFGLEEKEVSLFLACLQGTHNTPTSLSYDTGIKRSTVYYYLDILKKKGLIHENIVKKKRYIVAEDPEICVQRLIDQKKREVEKAENNVEKLLSMLQGKKKQETSPDARIEYYAGLEATKSLSMRLLGMQKDIHWIGDFGRVFNYISKEEFYRTFTLERMKHDTTTYAMTDKKILETPQFSEIIGNFRQFRFFEEDVQIPGLLAIAGDSLFLFSDADGVPSAVVIEDKKYERGGTVFVSEFVETDANFRFSVLMNHIHQQKFECRSGFF